MTALGVEVLATIIALQQLDLDDVQHMDKGKRRAEDLSDEQIAFKLYAQE